jgi:signal transduction histidine kinase
MREYKRRMGEVTRMKSDFGSLVSHELRTPLTSLKNVVDILLSGKLGVLEPRQSHLLSLAKKDTVRLWGLIANILDLSKLESGSTLLVQGEIQVREFLMSVMGRIKDQAREKGIVLEARVSRRLPRLSADPERLAQIIVNLLSNAIRFSASGGKIRVSARLIPDLSSRVPRARRLAAGWNASSVMHNGCGDGGSTHELPAGIHFVEISVRDWGMGISPARLDAIFDKYSQADPVMTRTSTGIGLGLTITRHLTLAHKGLIWVESREGAGSVFRCLLPVQGEEPSTAVHSNSTTPRA